MNELARTGLLFHNGNMLSAESWSRRHKGMSVLLEALVVGALPAGASMKHPPVISVVFLSFSVATMILDRLCSGRAMRACALTFGLFAAAASYVALFHGTPESHYTFFVLIGVIALYQDWRPFLIGIGFVLVHHTVLAVLLPDAVFGHRAGMPPGFRLPLLYSAFLLASSVASVVAWKANEAEASSDALTGLPNRRLLQTKLDKVMADTRSPGVGLIILDLCGFTKVNDAYGHAAGDRVLLEFSRRLEAICIAHSGLVARIGGDEFALVIPRAARAEVLAVADAVVQRIGDAVRLGERSAHLAASVGVLVCLPGAATTSEMMRDVDVAKDSAKRQYGAMGGMCVFEPTLRDRARESFELELDLSGCVERGELVLLYQPVVDLVTNRTVGAEALVRWDHPTLGRLGPQMFVGLAERTGDIVSIGRWVLGEAIRQLGIWNSTLPYRDALSMHVNLSTHQLTDSTLVQSLQQFIDEAGVGAGRVVIEITESAAVAGSDELAVIYELKGLGVRIALDDFGTGYSSLSHLARLPIDEIKIDKSFTDDIPTGPNGPLLAGVLALAGQIGMATVIDGVEYQDQADALTMMGARLAQGYLFGRPMEAADFDGRLAAQQLGAELTGQPLSMQTVLIVDDDELTSSMLARHLHILGYSTVQASCADHAHALARALPPAFAVVDVEMPGVDGWTLVERLRADEIVDGLQIVIVSGSSAPRHADRAHQEGLVFIDKGDRRLRSRLQEAIELLDAERRHVRH